MCKMSFLSPSEAMKRSNSAVSGANIGPSGSGKSTGMRKMVCGSIAQAISKAVGDTSQTTLIPADIVLDERISEDAFAIQIKRTEFQKKLIENCIMENARKPILDAEFDFEEASEEMNEEWFRKIEEPEDKAYHLGKLEAKENWKEGLLKALKPIVNEMAEMDFSGRVKEVKNAQKTKVKISEVKENVYEEFWMMVSETGRSELTDWLERVYTAIEEQIVSVAGNEVAVGKIVEFGMGGGKLSKDEKEILTNIIDPYTPFSLIIESITIACRPHEELIRRKKYKDIPLRFVLRDTIGLNQTASKPSGIRDSLEIALNRKVESIILFLNLEEKDEILFECCRALNENRTKMDQMNVPVYIVFTKADNYLKSQIEKASHTETVLAQEDYDNSIIMAVESLEKRIQSFESTLPEGQVTWLSLINLKKNIDPIQTALCNAGSGLEVRFQPEGIYSLYNDVINQMLSKTLPPEMKHPISITVKNIDKPAIAFEVNKEMISQNLEQLQNHLAVEKSNVNGYLITDKRRIHGRSVVGYWRNLNVGIGYKTNAHVFGNFQINMKGLLAKVLRADFPAIKELFRLQCISTDLSNLANEELEKLITIVDPDGSYSMESLSYVAPAIKDKFSDRDYNVQTLHYFFYEYFSSQPRNLAIIDRMAFELSINSPEIKKIMTDIYYSDRTYDEVIRMMQEEFRLLFASEKFQELIVRVFNEELTVLANKMFIVD